MLFAGSKNITLDQSKAGAHVKDQWLMQGFYSDCCMSCQELKHKAFADNEVQAALSKLALVQADVTQDNVPACTLLRLFGLIGPPAILFFGPDQSERKTYRIDGYVNSKQFLAQLHRMM